MRLTTLVAHAEHCLANARVKVRAQKRLVVRVRSHTHPGTFVSDTAKVSSPTPDPNGANNKDTATVKVRHP